MENGKRGQIKPSVLDSPDGDAVEAALVPELRDLFSKYPALLTAGPETAGRALHAIRGVRADVGAVEAVLEALRVEGEILA